MAALTTAQLKARMAVMRGAVVDTNHDFTTMTLEAFDVAYPLWSGGSKRYCLQANGDYIERDTDEAPLTDLGVWCDGAFTNYAVNGTLAGAVAGSPGTMPTLWTFDSAGGATLSSVAISTYKGLPLLTVVAAADASERHYLPNQYLSVGGTQGQVLTFSAFSAAETTAVFVANHPCINVAVRTGWTGSGNISITDTIAYHKTAPYTVPAGQIGSFYEAAGGYITSAGGGTITCKAAAPQYCINVGLSPNTIALSSASTTAHTADIIQRAVDLRGPFAVEIVATTAPGDPGVAQQLLCLSKDANNRINVSRYTSTNLVRVNSEVAGSAVVTTGTTVGDNTQTVVRMQVEFNGCRVSVGGNAPATISKARADTYILNTLGSDYNGTGSFWGSIQSFRILENYIATDNELQDGFAI